MFQLTILFDILVKNILREAGMLFKLGKIIHLEFSNMEIKN